MNILCGDWTLLTYTWDGIYLSKDLTLNLIVKDPSFLLFFNVFYLIEFEIMNDNFFRIEIF